MPSIGYLQQEAENINKDYEKFKASGISIDEEIEKDKKKRYAIDIKEYNRIKENTNKMLNSSIPTESLNLSPMMYIRPGVEYTKDELEELVISEEKRRREILDY